MVVVTAVDSGGRKDVALLPHIDEVKHELRPQLVIGDADGGRVVYIGEIGVLWMEVDNGEGAQRDKLVECWVDLGQEIILWVDEIDKVIRTKRPGELHEGSTISPPSDFDCFSRIGCVI